MDVFEAGFRFRDPWAFGLLALAALALLLHLRRERAPGGLLFSSVALLPGGGPSWRARGRWLLMVLRLLAVVLLVVALARPQVTRAAEDVIAEGIDVVLILDISSSMTSSDFGGASTKMDSAKRVVRDFLDGLSSDRVGVVVFSGDALVLSPLTLDYEALLRIVEPVEAGELLSGGTAIGTGLASGLNVLRDSGAKSRIAILLTDGENNSGDIRPLDAANMAKLLGVRVYAVGAITGFRSGTEERDLREMATRTGGNYYFAGDENALVEIYREIRQLEKSRVGSRTFADYEEAGVPFLALGALLALLEVILAASVLRRVP